MKLRSELVLEIIPFVHAVAYSILEELRDEDDEIVVVIALAGGSIKSYGMDVRRVLCCRCSTEIPQPAAAFSTVRFARCLAGIGVYLLHETWNSVNRNPPQLTIAILMAVDLVTRGAARFVESIRVVVYRTLHVSCGRYHMDTQARGPFPISV